MKRILISIVILIIGMTAYGQDMSYFKSEYMQADGTFAERLGVLEAIRDSGIAVDAEFYHEALKYLLLRSVEISTTSERAIAERSVIILCEGLGAAKYTEAAWDIWQAAELFDVSGNATDGNAMRAALIALGQIDGKALVPHIVQRLNEFNLTAIRNAEQRRRTQMAVLGCINALETLGDIRGFRPIFFASLGPYDASVKETASNALPNIVEDPSAAIIEIIVEPSSAPPVKLLVWREMPRSRMPDASKAKVAAAAMEIGWFFQTQNRNFQTNLRELRKAALDAIRLYGVADDSVYLNLEKSYSNNFISNNPDFDEIAKTFNALTALSTEPAVDLLHKFLREINGRRRSGPWGNKERQIYQWLTECIGKTGTTSQEVRFLLTTIQRNTIYTAQEREMAGNALKALGN